MLERRSRFVITAMVFAFAFLYIPIVSVIVYSFNESRLVTVWSGFSLKWWRALADNDQMVSAALASLQVAVVSATGAVILGTLAGVALARHRRFRGRTFFTGLITAPLVMPEVIMGISMLLLFVLLQNLTGWPERGFTTVAIAHITFTMAYVAVIVQSRLVSFDYALEEAAQISGQTLDEVAALLLDYSAPLAARLAASGRDHREARKHEAKPEFLVMDADGLSLNP